MHTISYAVLLALATAPNSYSAWEVYRVPLVSHSHNPPKQKTINNNYPSHHFNERPHDFNHDDFGRFSHNQHDNLNEWNTNNEDRVRTERQEVFSQNPIQTASEINVCVRNCPTTSEYNPVCGSNGVTYTNPSRLECVKFCGVDVQVSRYSRCPIPGLPTPSVGTTPTIPPSVRPTPATPPSIPTIPPTPSIPTTQSAATTITGSQDLTVPQNILDSIFTTDYSGLINERHDD